MCGQPRLARNRPGRVRAASRSPQSAALESGTAGRNYNECAQLSAVIVKANTNDTNPTTRAVMFHLGQFIKQGVPDTYGFTGVDESQSTGDTVALTYSGGITGLNSLVKFRWNGSGVEVLGNTPGG